MNTDVAYLSQLQSDLLAAAERGASRDRTSSRRMRTASIAAGMIVLAGIVGTVAPRLGKAPEHARSAAPAEGRSAAGKLEGVVPSPASGVLGAAQTGTAAQSEAAAGGAASRYGVSSGAAGAVTVPAFGPKIVKTAHMDLRVARGAFERAFGDAAQIASANGGFVVSSSSGGANARYGTMTLRIPSARFESALQSLRSVGTVTWQTVTGRDVTAAYIDLSGRIRTWRSQQAVLYRLMGRATSIGETLQIQSQLQRVQLTIEELQGELRLLRNQSAFGTVTLSIREAGVTPAATNEAAPPTMLRAWRNAVGGFLAVAAAVVIGLGYLIPIAVLCVIGWVLTRRVRKLASA